MIPDFLTAAYPRLLFALLGLTAAGAFFARASVRAALKGLGRRGALLGLGIVLLAAALRFSLPGRHLVFYDEYEHLNIIENLARLGRLAESLASGPEIDVLAPSPWPGGVHALWSLFLAPAGGGSRGLFRLNAAAGSLTAGLIFLIVWAATRRLTAACAAGLALSLMPLHARYSTCGDLTAASLMSLALALLARAAFDAKPSGPSLLWLALCCAWASQTRPEHGLLLILALQAAWIQRRRPAAIGAAGICLAAAAATLAIASHNRARGIPGYDSGLWESAGLLAANLTGNLLWLALSPVGLVLLAAGGWAAYRKDTPRWSLGLSAAYLLVYSSYFLGSFAHGTSDRYALAALLPLGAAAGAALVRPAPALAAAAAFALAWRSADLSQDPDHAAAHRFLTEEVASLPSDAWVAAFSPPAVLTAARRSAVSPLLLLETRDFDGKPLYLLRDRWTERRTKETKALGGLFLREVIRERAEGGTTFALERLTPRSRPARRDPSPI